MNKANFDQVKQLNVFKMSCDELDKLNKDLKKELKTIHLNTSASYRQRISQSPKISQRRNNMSPVRKTSPQRINDTIANDLTIETKHNIKEHSISKLDQNDGNKAPRRDNSFDYKIVKKDKLLIPMNSLDQGRNMRLCEKMLLPNEKNYFVSEKNFKLITEAINEKEVDIQSLNILLDLAKADLKINNEKFSSVIEENGILSKRTDQLTKDNKRLRIEYTNMTLQFNKMLSTNKNIILLLDYIHNNFGMNASGGDATISKGINDKIIELELNGALAPIKDTMLMHHINGDSTLNQNEALCKQYLKKLLDAEKYIDDLNKIKEDKFNNLSDNSKDLIQAKIRIKELNDLNEKLEHENAYLRIRYQNLKSENQGKPNDNIEQIRIQKMKVEELNKALSALNNDNLNLKRQTLQSKAMLSQKHDEFMRKEKEAAQLNNKMNLLKENIKEKDSIISQLKTRIDYLEKPKNAFNVSYCMTSPQSFVKYNNQNETKDSDFSDCPIKSSDDILKDHRKINKTMSSKNSEITREKGNMKEEKKDLGFEMSKDKVESW